MCNVSAFATNKNTQEKIYKYRGVAELYRAVCDNFLVKSMRPAYFNLYSRAECFRYRAL